jgi:hypothetical protein
MVHDAEAAHEVRSVVVGLKSSPMAVATTEFASALRAHLGRA